MRRLCFLLLTLFTLHLPPAFAFVINGNFDDPANTALVASDLTAPLFGSDFDIANNVALHTFTVASADTFTFDSNGFAAGGADPYFTLFSGTGNGATVFASNFTQAFSTGGDFVIALALAAGDYTIAMGVFSNLSFAENLGVGSLGDGFTALGGPGFLGNSYYELEVTGGGSQPPGVPEPQTVALLLAGLGLLRWRNRQR